MNFQNSAGAVQVVFISFKSNCNPLNLLCRTESEVRDDITPKTHAIQHLCQRGFVDLLSQVIHLKMFFAPNHTTQLLEDSDNVVCACVSNTSLLHASWAIIQAQKQMKTYVTGLIGRSCFANPCGAL